jgi:hypothetical protein
MHRLYPHGTGFFPELVFTEYPKISPPRALIPMVKTSNIIRHKVAPEVSKYGTPSVALCADGKLIVTYYDYIAKKIYCSRIDDPMSIFSVDNCAKNATEYEFTQFTVNAGSWDKTAADTEYQHSRSKLFKNALGDLLLFVYDPGHGTIKSRIQVWKSISGNGIDATDWALFGTVLDTATPARGINAFNTANTNIGCVNFLSTGRIIFCYGKLTDHATSGGWVDWQYAAAYSDDNGITWTSAIIQAPATLSGSVWGVGGIVEAANCIYTKCGNYTGGVLNRQRFGYSLDFGATWALCDELVKIGTEPDGMHLNAFMGVDYNLMFRSVPGSNVFKIYKSSKLVALPLTGQDPYRSSIWSQIDAVTYNLGYHSTQIEKLDYVTTRLYIGTYMTTFQANLASGWYMG